MVSVLCEIELMDFLVHSMRGAGGYENGISWRKKNNYSFDKNGNELRSVSSMERKLSRLINVGII